MDMLQSIIMATIGQMMVESKPSINMLARFLK